MKILNVVSLSSVARAVDLQLKLVQLSTDGHCAGEASLPRSQYTQHGSNNNYLERWRSLTRDYLFAATCKSPFSHGLGLETCASNGPAPEIRKNLGDTGISKIRPKRHPSRGPAGHAIAFETRRNLCQASDKRGWGKQGVGAFSRRAPPATASVNQGVAISASSCSVTPISTICLFVSP
jgi:hypothetical protein